MENKVENKEKEVAEKFLSDKEMFEIEKNSLESKSFKQNEKVLSLQEKLLKKEINNLELSLRLLQHEKVKQRENETNRVMIYKDFLKRVKERLNIKDKFGFNPDTGEIINS